jgi:hypothetical protein
MKKNISFSTVLLIVFVGLSSIQMKAQTPMMNPVTEQQNSKKYTCPMHPEVVTDKPGKCPKCGMTLIEKTDQKQGGIHNMHNMKNMKNMNDTTMMKHDSTKMKKCCMMENMSSGQNATFSSFTV